MPVQLFFSAFDVVWLAQTESFARKALGISDTVTG
jgi:hypothetical protein